jgi:hypothetical protein
MWLSAMAAVVLQRKALGKVSIAIALAFSPFAVLGAQNYGGEAIYRVFLFSSPWCALLIAEGLTDLVKARPASWARAAIIGACSFALAGGLQGLYGPVAAYTFTPSELAARLWLYSHAAPNSIIIQPVDNIPMLETANYNAYGLQNVAAGLGAGGKQVNEGNVAAVESWMSSLKGTYAYVVFSRSMGLAASYNSAPRGYEQLASTVRDRIGWNVVYRNADTTIYQFPIVPAGS